MPYETQAQAPAEPEPELCNVYSIALAIIAVSSRTKQSCTELISQFVATANYHIMIGPSPSLQATCVHHIMGLTM